MSKKTQKGSGIWKRIKSMLSKKKSQLTNNKKPLINQTDENQKILKKIGTKAENLLNELDSNKDTTLINIAFNINILEGIVEICKKKEKDKAIKELKDLRKLKEITSSINSNNNLDQWNDKINEIKKLIKKL